MSKSILVAVALAVVITACGDSCKAYTDKVESQQDTACGNYMNNTQIIEETKNCYDAGLDAEPLHCGDDFKTTSIQCKPRTQGSVE